MSEKDELIKYLVSKKFPVNYISREKRLVRQIQIKEEMWLEIDKNINTYIDELTQKALEEVIELSKTEEKKASEEHEKQQQECERRRQKKLFFNQPNTKADFDYWCKMSSWTTDEAVALLLDKDPRVVSWKNIFSYANPVRDYNKPEIFAKEYQNLRELLIRQYGTNQDIKIVPSELIDWANGVGLEVPEELQKIVSKRKDASADWKVLHAEKCLEVEQLKKNFENSQNKRKEHIVKVRASTNSNRIPKMALAVIAKDKYKYGKDCSAIGNMLSYFDRQGLNIDDKTLRGHIDEGLLLVKNKKPI